MYDDNEGYAPGLSGLEKSMTEIKRFSAVFKVTVFEFLDKVNTYCTGRKKAKAYKLYNNYLSPSNQAQTASFQQDFDGMVNYLKLNYNKMEVISNRPLAELERRKKPENNDLPERGDSLLAIMNVILRLQNLKTKLPEKQVMTQITSYNFLHRIQNLLSTADYIELSKDLVADNIDNRVAARFKALDLTLNQLKNTIAVLESVMEKLKGKGKTRSVHTVGNHEDPAPPENRDMEKHPMDRCDWLYRINDRLVKSGKGWKPELWFPCLLDSHVHELFQCEAFLAMSLKDQQRAGKGKICQSCLKPGEQCIGKDKKCNTEVPKGLLRPGCVSFTMTQNRLSPHCMLFCEQHTVRRDDKR